MKENYQSRFIWRDFVALCAFDRCSQMNGFNVFLKSILIYKWCTANITMRTRTRILKSNETILKSIAKLKFSNLLIRTIWLPDPASDRWTVWMWLITLVLEIKRFPQNSHISPAFGSFLWTKSMWFSSDFVDVYLNLWNRNRCWKTNCNHDSLIQWLTVYRTVDMPGISLSINRVPSYAVLHSNWRKTLCRIPGIWNAFRFLPCVWQHACVK